MHKQLYMINERKYIDRIQLLSCFALVHILLEE